MKKYLAILVLLLPFAAADASIFNTRDLLILDTENVPVRPDGSASSLLDVQNSIEEACRIRGWETTLAEDGTIHASISWNRIYVAEVQISFSENTYSFDYLSSKNLNYKEKRQTIHRAYNNHLKSLADTVDQYLRSKRTIVAEPLNIYTTMGVEEPPVTEVDVVDLHFSDRTLGLVEGIWTWHDNTYQIAIIRNTTGLESQYDYIGVIVRAELNVWKPGDVKLLLNSTASPSIFTGVYFDGKKGRVNLSYVMDDTNVITVNQTFTDGQPMLLRDYPVNGTQAVSIGGKTVSMGTCFVVGPKGTAVTSNHVIDEANSVLVTLADGRELTATVESSSAATDIAVLNLHANTPHYLSLASTRSVSAGEPVFTVGFPTIELLGSEAKFTEGSISALSGLRGEASYMQISVPVQPGNSGGPIVSYRGEVLGVVASTAAVEAFYKVTGSLPQNVNWAVKSDFVRPMVDDAPRRPRATSRASAIAAAQAAACRVSASN